MNIVTDTLTISGTTESTTKDTGSIVVAAGGLGTSGTLFVGGGLLERTPHLSYLHHNTTQNITGAGGQIRLNLNTSDYDNYSMNVTGTPGYIQTPYAGMYYIFANVYAPGSAGKDMMYLVLDIANSSGTQTDIIVSTRGVGRNSTNLNGYHQISGFKKLTANQRIYITVQLVSSTDRLFGETTAHQTNSLYAVYLGP